MTSSLVTIFAVDQIAAEVRAFFAAPGREVSAEVVVDEWDRTKHYGRPIVVMGIGTWLTVGAAAFPPGFRWAPNSLYDLGAGRFAPVVGARIQKFTTWVHSLGGEFGTSDSAVLQVAARTAAFELLDRLTAALRDIHGADLPPAAGEPVKAEGDEGDWVYGSVLKWVVEIPVPILGDVAEFVVPDKMDGHTSVIVNGTESVPGDTLSTDMNPEAP